MHTAFLQLLKEVDSYQKNKNHAFALKHGGKDKIFLFILYDKQVKPIERVASTDRLTFVATKFFKLIRFDKQKKCVVFQPYGFPSDEHSLAYNITISLNCLSGFHCFVVDKSWKADCKQPKEEEQNQQKKINPFTDVLKHGNNFMHTEPDNGKETTQPKTEEEKKQKKTVEPAFPCPQPDIKPPNYPEEVCKEPTDEAKDDEKGSPYTENPPNTEVPEKDNYPQPPACEKPEKTVNVNKPEIPADKREEPCPVILPETEEEQEKNTAKPMINDKPELPNDKHEEPCSVVPQEKKDEQEERETTSKSCSTRIIPIQNIKSIEYRDD